MKAISNRALAISCLQACAIFGAGYIARGRPASTGVPKGAFFLLVEMEFKSVADREKAEAILALVEQDKLHAIRQAHQACVSVPSRARGAL